MENGITLAVINLDFATGQVSDAQAVDYLIDRQGKLKFIGFVEAKINDLPAMFRNHLEWGRWTVVQNTSEDLGKRGTAMAWPWGQLAIVKRFSLKVGVSAETIQKYNVSLLPRYMRVIDVAVPRANLKSQKTKLIVAHWPPPEQSFLHWIMNNAVKTQLALSRFSRRGHWAVLCDSNQYAETLAEKLGGTVGIEAGVMCIIIGKKMNLRDLFVYSSPRENGWIDHAIVGGRLTV